ncbi:hypothetical protein GM658_19260 [Pseudoduganella eburnea]|uniref:Uncharacterized protein n=1 Tax=Massilia eburnea TaxID=1776165 RepID=A0A6L6QKU9_9BURK|nr:hypothetical protein [Massilia eburnea]MTW12750.1 hypothetical protein [Massilia eburnea]
MRKHRPITLRSLFEMLAFFTAALAVFASLDVLFIGHGIDAFRPTVIMPATVVAVGEERIERQLSRRGNQKARMEYRVRPTITYQFELNGEPRLSSRYFLHESPVLADLPERRMWPGSVTLRMAPNAVVGKQLQVHAVPDAPELSYVDWGWEGLADTLAFWGRAWLVFALFSLVSWLMLLGFGKFAIAIQGEQSH